MDYSYSGIYPIRTHEIDQHKLLTVPSLVLMMQDASMQNVMELKASVWDLESMKVSWVLLRKELTILRLPTLGEEVHIATYPTGFDRVFAFRDYKAFDQQNQLIAYAGSTWTLMHTETRKMVRIPSSLFAFDMTESRDILPRPKSKIPLLDHKDYEQEYQVNWFDLDWNGHVNNVFIVRCLVEAVPDPLITDHRIQHLSIHFRSECMWKDKLLFQSGSDGSGTRLHSVINRSNNQLVASAFTKWTSK